MFETLRMYFQYPFVRYALIVGVLIALCSSLLGVTLVLKRFSFIGDGLSHVAFGAMAIASVLNITNNMLFILPVTVVCAIFLLRAGQNTMKTGTQRSFSVTGDRYVGDEAQDYCLAHATKYGTGNKVVTDYVVL